MNSLRDLSRRVDNVTVPALDIDALVAQGDHRLRRRRLTVLLASAAAVIVVTALAAGGAALHRSAAPGPTDTPSTPNTDQNPPPHVALARKIVYSDIPAGSNGLAGYGDTVHYGDRVVETGIGFTQIDVTDDGFVYITDGRGLVFSDGGEPEEIGTDVCPDEPGFPGVQVKTANEGSLVAWLECPQTAPVDVVVFDTSLGREVAREPIAGCGAESGCHPDAVVGNHVYIAQSFFRQGTGRAASHTLKLDLGTGRITAVKVTEVQGREVANSYLEDVRGHPRGLVIGDSWQSGWATDAIGQAFWVDGSRLVPVDRDGARTPVAATAFDSATQRPIQLQLPRGYPAHHDALGRGDFSLFEWIDDNTVALVGPSGWDDAPGYGDILRCTLSDGSCELAVPGDGPVRVVPHIGLPG